MKGLSPLLSVWPYAFAMLAAGLLPVQAALTGALNRVLRQPPLVVLISLCGSFVCIVAFGLASGRLAVPGLGQVARVPIWAWPAGVCGAIFLLSQPVVLPRIGAAAFVGLGVTAQILMSITLDHFGLLGLPQHPASPLRLAGAALMVAGISVIARF